MASEQRKGEHHMNGTDLNLGIIGTNFVADWLVETADRTEGIACAAVYSRTEERGGAFAGAHGIPAVYTDMEAFLSSPIDAVYIASPNFLHFPQAMDAVRHGKHVLVEKPISNRIDEAREMVAYAAKKGIFKGSFKAYSLQDAFGGKKKLKKHKVDVIGFVVDGVGTGEASCKRPAGGPWAVSVE